MTMTIRTGTVSAAGILAFVSSCASAPPAPPAETPPAPAIASTNTSTPGGAERATKITLTAKVVDLDRKQRLLTLRDHNGETQTIQVDEKARNLAHVKAGDNVIVTYYESTAFKVVPPGEMQVGVHDTAQAERAAQGAAPGGKAARVTTVVADIAKLDREKQEAVLRGSKGQLMTVHVADPANFDKVKVGDRVQITLSEALAVDVEPAPTK
jgi:hypothetical protein